MNIVNVFRIGTNMSISRIYILVDLVDPFYVAKVECCNLCDNFGNWVTDRLDPRIPPSSSTSHHPHQTGGLFGEVLPFFRSAVSVF